MVILRFERDRKMEILVSDIITFNKAMVRIFLSEGIQIIIPFIKFIVIPDWFSNEKTMNKMYQLKILQIPK